jgi:hypothetical protein
MNESSRTWLARWVGTALLVIVLVGVVNAVVDPYGLFGWYDARGFNQQKEGVRNRIRHVKALELPLRKPRTVLLGSSRVHDGLDPAHPLLQDAAPVYNLAVEMCRVHEALQYLRHALVQSDVKRVVIGLDFFMFNSRERTNRTFEPALVGREVGMRDYVTTALLSRDALDDSITTVRTSRNQPDRREFLSNGFRPGNMVFYKVADYQKLHYYTNWIFLTSSPQATKYYADMALDADVFAEFGALLDLCRDRGLDCRLYINPAHATLDGEAIRAAGLAGPMEEWRRRITHIAGEHRIPLWDFGGYNSITEEPVATPMKYYWDSSHFTVGVGNWILTRVMGGSDATLPADFGVQLTDTNIDAHLQAMRDAREQYAARNPESTATLAHAFESYLHGAPLDVQRLEGTFSE